MIRDPFDDPFVTWPESHQPDDESELNPGCIFGLILCALSALLTLAIAAGVFLVGQSKGWW